MWAHSAAEIGKILAMARRQRQLTQAQLAQAVGATQTWVSMVEQGKETAQLGKVLRLLAYLGVRLQVGEAPWIEAKTASSRHGSRPLLADIVQSHAVEPAGKRRR